MDNTDKIVELRCNIDDMTGEDLAYAIEKLMDAGALDAFAVPVIMKKGRGGFLLTVLTDEERKKEIAEVIFAHTSTIGIREFAAERMVLARSVKTVHTKYGDVRIKVSEGYGVKKEKPEFDDIKKISESTGMSTAEVRKIVEAMSRYDICDTRLL